MRQGSAGVLVCLSWLGLAHGCGSSGGDGGTAVPIQQFAEARNAATCDLIFRCTSVLGLGQARLLYGTVENCRTLANALIRSADLDDLQRAVNAGTARYDGATARRCLDAYATTCEITAEPVVCRGVFTGTVAAGGACWRSEECAGDGYCSHASAGQTQACPGRCTARAALGARCADSTECSLIGVTGEPRCVENVCVDRRRQRTATEGAACDVRSMSSPTVQVVTACTPGLVCAVSIDSTPSVCRRPAAVGMPCTLSPGCADGSLCINSTPGGTQTCTAITVRTRAGEPCTTASGPQPCSVVARLRCGASGTCEPFTVGGEGAACGGDYSGFQCSAGLACNDTTLRCERRAAVGAPCEFDPECETDSCVNGVCAARICR